MDQFAIVPPEVGTFGFDPQGWGCGNNLEPGMSARAIWKANLRFKNIQVPVKLYSAVQERSVHFRMLHDQDMVPVQQKMVNALTGKDVEHRAALKGAEVEPGVHIVITQQ